MSKGASRESPLFVLVEKELFLRLLVLGHRAVPLTPFLELYFALDKLLVLARPIVDAAAFSAREFYELILGHETRLYPKRPPWSTAVNADIYRDSGNWQGAS